MTAASQWAHIMPSTFSSTVCSPTSGPAPSVCVLSGLPVSVGAFSPSAGRALCRIGRSWEGSWILKRFRRSAFMHTVKLERLMAAAPIIGFIFQVVISPAASGMQITL